jgi:hypothetical protein
MNEDRRNTEYENFLVMAHNAKNVYPNYTTFLNYRETLNFVKAMANNNSDVFSYKGTIYNKKISIGDAQNILRADEQRRFDRNIRKCANQLGLRI